MVNSPQRRAIEPFVPGIESFTGISLPGIESFPKIKNASGGSNTVSGISTMDLKEELLVAHKEHPCKSKVSKEAL